MTREPQRYPWPVPMRAIAASMGVMAASSLVTCAPEIVIDTNRGDAAERYDASVPDTNAPDNSSGDVHPPDTGANDAGISDADSHDADTHDTGPPRSIALRPTHQQLELLWGGSTEIAVEISRELAGTPVTLDVVDAPSGVDWRWSESPTAASLVSLHIDVSPGARLGTSRITLRGEADGAVATAPVAIDVIYRLEGHAPWAGEWSSAATGQTPTGARLFLGPFNAETVTLSFDDVAIHQEIQVDINLFVIGSWDGDDPLFGPDMWDAWVAGGPPLFQTTFANAEGTTQTFPDSFPVSGAQYPAAQGANEVNTLGYKTDWFDGDAVYRLSFAVPHVARTVELAFTASNLEGIDSESWGLAAVEVRAVTSASGPTLQVESDVDGDLYLNGRFTGQRPPATLPLRSGPQLLGLISDDARYQRVQIEGTGGGNQTIHLEDSGWEPQRTWEILFVAVETMDVSYLDEEGVTQSCQTTLPNERRVEAYWDLLRAGAELAEPFSGGTVTWQVSSRLRTEPVTSLSGEAPWYYLLPEDLPGTIDDVMPADVDAVYVLWNPEGDGCTIPAAYFGLAIYGNQPGSYGYINVLEASWWPWGEDESGVWLHEWLHTVETFYIGRGARLPTPPPGEPPLHAGEIFGYTYPWMDWLHDFMSAQVLEQGAFVGIGPEAFFGGTLRSPARPD